MLGERLVHVLQRAPGHLAVHEVVPVLGELVEDRVALVGGQPGALVVDLLDVALGPGRPHHVGRIGHPPVEPFEALGAHAFREHGDAPAVHDPRDRHAAPAVVPRRGPHRPLRRRIERPGHHPRRQARVRGEHLVGADHREPVAERDDDLRVDPGQLPGEHDVLGHRDPTAAVGAVVPVHPEQVEGMRLVGPHARPAPHGGSRAPWRDPRAPGRSAAGSGPSGTVPRHGRRSPGPRPRAGTVRRPCLPG